MSLYTVHCAFSSKSKYDIKIADKPTPIDSQALAAQAAAAPSENAETPSSKKEKKRKRKSEVVKNGDIDAGNTSEAQVAKELIPEKTAESGKSTNGAAIWIRS